MTRSLLSALWFCFFIHSAAFPGMAQADPSPEKDPIVKLQKAGWKIVQDGVLRRESKPNEVETFVFGEAGFSWKLRALREQLQVLRREFQAHPTPELRKVMASHRKLIASTLKMIERARAADASRELKTLKTGCVPTFTYSANASYKTNRQGTRSEAVADFKVPEGCNSFGEVYAYAFAKTSANEKLSTTAMADGPRIGSNVRASADANRNGGDLCNSYAYATVTSYVPVPTSYSISQTNSLCPAGPGSSLAKIVVTVKPVDENPTATPDFTNVTEDSNANVINVMANDTDPDGGSNTVASVTQPANGVVVITGGATELTYTPNANYCNSFSGTPDTFTYTLTPGGSTATVSVIVICVDDSTVAVNDAATVSEDSSANAINVLANDIDTDGSILYPYIQSVTQPANGTVINGGSAVSYTPNANYCNNHPDIPDTFTYTLTPGGSTATVTVTVNCLNDKPVLDLDGNDDQGTPGNNFAVTFTEGDAATQIEDPVDATITDIDNAILESLTVTITNLLDPGDEILLTNVTGTSITANYDPTTGILTLTGPDTTANFQTVLRKIRYLNTSSSPDTTLRVIHFVANDGASNSNTAAATVTVVPVDNPPTAVSDSASVVEDSGVNEINVLANDTDADGGPISIASVTQPANGTVVITGGGTGLTYIPNPNYCNNPSGSPDTFTYTVTPGSSTATVSVIVTCVDDNPVAVNDEATVGEDSGTSAINVLANDTDPDGGSKSVASVTQPTNGTVVITGGGTGLTYTPNRNYCNSVSGPPDTFTYTLTPGGSAAIVSVTVTCAHGCQ